MDRFQEFILTGQLPSLQEETEKVLQEKEVRICSCGKNYPQNLSQCPECGKKNPYPHGPTHENWDTASEEEKLSKEKKAGHRKAPKQKKDVETPLPNRKKIPDDKNVWEAKKKEEYHYDPTFSNDTEHNEYLTYSGDTKSIPKEKTIEKPHYGKQVEDYNFDPKDSNDTSFENDLGFQKFYAEQLQKECATCGDMSHKPEEDEKKVKEAEEESNEKKIAHKKAGDKVWLSHQGSEDHPNEGEQWKKKAGLSVAEKSRKREDFDEPTNGIESRPGHRAYNVPELSNDTVYGEDEREFGRTFPVGDKNSPTPVDTEGYGYEGESQEGFEPSFEVGAGQGSPMQHDSANLGYDPYDPSKFDRSDDWDGKGRDASLPTYTFQSEGKKINLNKLIEKAIQRGMSRQQIKELIKTVMGKKKASRKQFPEHFARE